MKHAFYISIILILTALDIYLISRLAWKEYSDDSIGGFTQEYVVSNITGMDQLLKNGGLTLDSTAVFKPDGTACGLFEDGTRRYLVCRISQYDCDVCTDYALEKFASVNAGDYGAKALVLANYPSGKVIEIIRQRHSAARQIGFYRMEDVNLPAENAGMPYYFILDDNMKVNDVFFPDRLLPEMTSGYFEKIKEKYSVMDGR